jgi:hypothetical protein
VAWTLIDEDAVGFHDAGAGHPYTFPAGAPSVGELDVVFVNSNTVLDVVPSGWTRSLNPVVNQGAYALWRIAVGGESDNVVIDMGGNFNTCLSWSRWSGADALDVAVEAHADGSPASTTPPVSTGTLADADELVVAAALLQGSFPTITPAWSSGYTPLTGVQYNAGTIDEVSAYTAYRVDGGTTAETPQADWTTTPSAPISDRYILVLTFTPLGGTDATAAPASVDAVTTIPGVTVSTGSTVTPSPVTATATVPTPGISTGATASPSAVAAIADVPALTISVQEQATVTPVTVAAVATVPGPAITIGTSAFPTPGAVAAVASIPTPVAGEVVEFGGWGVLTLGVPAAATLTATSSGPSLLATVAP